MSKLKHSGKHTLKRVCVYYCSICEKTLDFLYDKQVKCVCTTDCSLLFVHMFRFSSQAMTSMPVAVGVVKK